MTGATVEKITPTAGAVLVALNDAHEKYTAGGRHYYRGQAWSLNDIAVLIIGHDPAAARSQWSRRPRESFIRELLHLPELGRVLAGMVERGELSSIIGREFDMGRCKLTPGDISRRVGPTSVYYYLPAIDEAESRAEVDARARERERRIREAARRYVLMQDTVAAAVEAAVAHISTLDDRQLAMFERGLDRPSPSSPGAIP